VTKWKSAVERVAELKVEIERLREALDLVVQRSTEEEIVRLAEAALAKQ
jgi:hypothetical protein